MKLIKKVLSVVLALLIALLSGLTVFGINEIVPCNTPIVLISGDAVPIVDANGNMAFSTSEIGALLSRLRKEGETTADAVLRIFGGILKTYYTGCITQNFNPYYQTIYDSIEPVMEPARLDCNGEPTNGSSIGKYFINRTNSSKYTVFENLNCESYSFFYDWRLDPYDSADKLNEYIEAVKKTTGKDKVGIICRCLGANVFLAYVERYGMDSIKGVGFDGVVVNGCEFLSEPVNGRIVADTRAISRFLTDFNAVQKASIDPEIISAVDDATDSGLVGLVKFIVKFPNYYRIRKGITSAVSLATFYTWPNYWAAVSSEDYQTALEFVFGKPGSELRQQYARLIEKLDYYDVHVRQRVPELMDIINSNANFAVISKYGVQLAPIAESRNKVGDQLISAEKSSFGATTSDIFTPLSDKYVQSRIEKGLGKYISPDRQIDASTCLFPEQTFFMKGASHSDWTEKEMELLVKVIEADTQLTIDDLPEYHFMTFSYDTMSGETMTEENCRTEAWEAKKGNIFPSFSAFIRLIKFVAKFIPNS